VVEIGAVAARRSVVGIEAAHERGYNKRGDCWYSSVSPNRSTRRDLEQGVAHV
jgi:hypothetical protein